MNAIQSRRRGPARPSRTAPADAGSVAQTETEGAARRGAPRVRDRSFRAAPCSAIAANAPAGTNRPDESLEVQVTYRTIEELKPPKRQLRVHKPKQVEQIIASIRRMGFINPIIVNAELGIVCGVGRYLAAREIGLARVPVIKVDHLTETELRAYALADNKLVLNDAWDEKLLAVELGELLILDHEVPIEFTGFDMIEVDNLLQVVEAQDDIPAMDDSPPVSRLGDLFDLDGHRLLCGDSCKEEGTVRATWQVRSLAAKPGGWLENRGRSRPARFAGSTLLRK